MSKTWFITGGNRGLGAEIAKAALAAGHKVVVTSRLTEGVADRFGNPENLQVVALDVTDADGVKEAVQAATDRFGAIDVLVNNAGYGQFGVFEEVSTDEIRAQFETNVFGLIAVTQAVLPAMRERRSGRVFNISSIAGLRGAAGFSVYAASKFAVEGLTQGIADEVKPFGVHVTSVSPGYFRTDFLEGSSIRYSEGGIADYAEGKAAFREFHDGRNGTQPGDPAKLAKVLVELSEAENPPVSFVAGTDAVAWAENAADTLKGEVAAWREASSSTDGDW